jgi:F-type H+-transporting ATPase subunit epsilon
MATMRVELVAPDRAVWSGAAEAVYARTTDGELGVMAGHVPLLGELEPGPVRIVRDVGELAAAVHGGFLSVTADGVSILAELVELAEEIDVARARRDVERARQAPEDDEDTLARGRRAEARLQVVGESV